MIDADTTAPYKAWEEMGRPTYLDRAQVLALENASQLVYDEIAVDETAPRLTFTAKSESVTIFKITLA